MPKVKQSKNKKAVKATAKPDKETTKKPVKKPAAKKKPTPEEKPITNKPGGIKTVPVELTVQQTITDLKEGLLESLSTTNVSLAMIGKGLSGQFVAKEDYDRLDTFATNLQVDHVNVVQAMQQEMTQKNDLIAQWQQYANQLKAQLDHQNAQYTQQIQNTPQHPGV